jgi:chromosome segregation ATPase
MNTRTVIPFAVIVLVLAAAPAFSQGQGKGSQNGGSPRSGQTQGQGPHGRDAATGQATQTQERDRIQATVQQRDQVRSCDQSADQVRTRAGQIAKKAQGNGFNADAVRQERNRLQEQVATMQQEQERLMAGLNDTQRSALQQRTQNMSRLHERLRTQMRALDAELGKADADGKQVARQAREVESTAKELREQYRAVQSQMVVQP